MTHCLCIYSDIDSDFTPYIFSKMNPNHREKQEKRKTLFNHVNTGMWVSATALRCHVHVMLMYVHFQIHLPTPYSLSALNIYFFVHVGKDRKAIFDITPLFLAFEQHCW